MQPNAATEGGDGEAGLRGYGRVSVRKWGTREVHCGSGETPVELERRPWSRQTHAGKLGRHSWSALTQGISEISHVSVDTTRELRM